MIKTIEKKYELNDGYITLYFSDPRDNYIYSTALGDIGNITICENGVFILSNQDNDEKIVVRREKILLEAFKEIFGIDKIDYLSSEYYPKIKTMIENGTLTSLGYKIVIQSEEEFDDIISYHYNKRNKRH